MLAVCSPALCYDDDLIDENMQIDDANVQGTVASPSTLNQYNKNVTQNRKQSKGKLSKVFQKSIAFLAKAMDIQWRKRKDYDFNIEASRWDNATQLYHRFSVVELRAATNDVNNHLIIRQGGTSQVYNGWINNGTLEVAIKCLKALTSSNELYILRAEIEAQSQLRHLHIIPLIGYCDEEGKPMLVYNYMANGWVPLQSSLFIRSSSVEEATRDLHWCCKGIAIPLHSGTTQKIIHSNIKSAKILLDENWVAKFNHFELSKVVPTGSTGITIGYLDPEYLHCQTLTEKSDAYAFGVVLLEILCARMPQECSKEDHKQLVPWFKTCIRMKTIDEIIDPYLVGRIASECLREFVTVTWNCLLGRGRARPSMDDVVGSLQLALQLQQTWHDDTELRGASCDDDDDPVKVWFHKAFARAYNNVLSYDNDFNIAETGSSGLSFSTLDLDCD